MKILIEDQHLLEIFYNYFSIFLVILYIQYLISDISHHKKRQLLNKCIWEDKIL